jgi:hypothetical protein
MPAGLMIFYFHQESIIFFLDEDPLYQYDPIIPFIVSSIMFKTDAYSGKRIILK